MSLLWSFISTFRSFSITISLRWSYQIFCCGTLYFIPVPSGATPDVNYLLNKHLLSIASIAGIPNHPAPMSTVQTFQWNVCRFGSRNRPDRNERQQYSFYASNVSCIGLKSFLSAQNVPKGTMEANNAKNNCLNFHFCSNVI